MQELKLRIRGLYTHPSDLVAVPDGALSRADDIVIDREDTAEPRRGFNKSSGAFSDSTYRASRLFMYQNYLFAQYSTNLLAYYSTILDSSSANFSGSGTWTGVSGTYAPATGTKMRNAEANQNLYFSSGAGVYKLDAYNATPSRAGAYKALDIEASIVDATGNWLLDTKYVVYRVVWGYRDANNNLILGAPSQRELIQNTALATRSVHLKITIPSGITTAWFYQVYRSAAEDAEPNDELQLVYEDNPNSTDLSNNYVEFDDITPDELRGATIYTAATQEGLAKGNEQPPLCTDISVFKNTMFYANTTSKHRKYLTLLSVGGTNGLAADDVVTIAGVSYVGKSTETTTSAEFKVYTLGSASQNVRDTALSLVRVINRYTSSTVYAYYVSGPDDLPGKILLEERSIGGSAFHIGTTRGSAFSPSTVPTALAISAVDTTAETFTSNSHGYSNAQALVLTLAGSAVLPSGVAVNTVYYVVGATTNTFQLAATSGGSAINLGSGFSGTVHVTPTSEASSNDRFKNAVYYSKTSQPEAVPLPNYFFAGSADKEILRIVPLRDSLFILKEDGIYRLSGEDSSSFRIDLFDSTTRLLASESAVVLNNQIFCLTDQGVVSISESGAQVRSRAIETTIQSLLGINAAVLRSESFGVAYDTERKYLLFVPTLAGDTSPTQAFVFNTFTNSWTRWVLSKTCGVVNAKDDKLYLGDGDTAYVNQERKSLTFQDYVDYGFSTTITAVAGLTLSMSGTDEISAGDVIYQSATVYSIVDSVDTVAGTVDVLFSAAFTTASADVLKAIPSKIAWVPITLGNPGALKQFREVTLLFKADFTGNATLVFTSDVSPARESETVVGTDIGLWGLFFWGGVPWGGTTNRRPIRLWIPRNKQRASQLTIEFQHSVGYAKYQLNGLSIIANGISEKVSV